MNDTQHQPDTQAIKAIRREIEIKERAVTLCASRYAASLLEAEIQQLAAKIVALQVSGGHEMRVRG